MATTHGVVPKFSKETLVPLVGYFAVLEDAMYNYYPVILGNTLGKFIEILKPPPVLSEGFVTVGDKVYSVNLKDLMRRKVNVGNEPVSVAVEPTKPTVKPRASTELLEQRDPNLVKSRVSIPSEFQDSEVVNLAWTNQINSLLHLEDPEAEWEFLADSPQPQPTNESSPAQDIVEAA
jgi:hypothetical protein